MRFWLLLLAAGVLAPSSLGQAPSQCIECHRSQTPEVVAQHASSAHAAGRVDCAGCHGGDSRATVEEAAHDSAHGYLGAIGASGAPAACGQCHSQEHAAYEASPHGEALRYTGQPSCIDCHGAHDARVPDDVAETCVGCHEGPLDPGSRVAGQMAALVATANRQIEELGAVLARGADGGGEIKQRMLESERKRILDLRARARRIAHTLDPEALGASVRHLGETVQTTAAVADSDLEEERGFAMQTVVLIFAAIALGLLASSVLLAIIVFRLARRLRRRGGPARPMPQEVGT